MRYLKYLALLAALLFISPGSVKAQDYDDDYYVGYGSYGPPPVCSYGYFNYYPYGCAPYGYWGPDYFVDGVFIGVGPWYNFYNRYPGYWGGFFVGGFRDRGFRRFHDDGFRRFDRFEGRGFRERDFRGFHDRCFR